MSTNSSALICVSFRNSTIDYLVGWVELGIGLITFRPIQYDGDGEGGEYYYLGDYPFTLSRRCGGASQWSCLDGGVLQKMRILSFYFLLNQQTSHKVPSNQTSIDNFALTVTNIKHYLISRLIIPYSDIYCQCLPHKNHNDKFYNKFLQASTHKLTKRAQRTKHILKQASKHNK